MSWFHRALRASRFTLPGLIVLTANFSNGASYTHKASSFQGEDKNGHAPSWSLRETNLNWTALLRVADSLATSWLRHAKTNRPTIQLENLSNPDFNPPKHWDPSVQDKILIPSIMIGRVGDWTVSHLSACQGTKGCSDKNMETVCCRLARRRQTMH